MRVCVGETSGKLLIKDNQDCAYIVGLQTGVMETVTEWFRGNVATAIQFKMDWPAFFMSRLAGGTIVKRTKLGGVIAKIINSFWGRIIVSVIFGAVVVSWG